MKRYALLIAGMVMLLMAALLSVSTSSATAAETAATPNNDQVCQGLDSGKIDVSGDEETLTLTAPAGQLIDAYCVKAGSANQDDGGPVYVSVNPPAKTVTISHPTGKDISHYSLSYVPSDVCPNMPGEQPPGSDCEPDDACPEMDGNQPPGTDCDEDDACPDMPGHQPPGTDCDEDEDACPDMPGYQPPGTDCDVEEECPDGDYNGDEEGCGTCPPKDGCPPPIQPDDDGDLRCVGRIFGGLYANVVVPRGQSCTLVNSYVNGDVTSSRGRDVRILDTVVVGDVTLDRIKRNVKIGNKVGCSYDPRVGKSITVTNSHNVLICEMRVCEKIVVAGNDGRITLRSNKAPRIKVIDNRRYDRRAFDDKHNNPGAIRILRNKMNRLVVEGNHSSRDVIKRRNSYSL